MKFLKHWWQGSGKILIISLIIIEIYRPFSWSRAYIIGPHTTFSEFLFVLSLFVLLYFPQRRFIMNFFGAFVILVLYASFDLFGSFMKRAPRVSDLENAHNLFGFSPFLGIAFYGMLMGICLLFVYILFTFARDHQKEMLYRFLGFKILLLVLSVGLTLSGGFKKWVLATHKDRSWEPMKEIKYNGRFMSFAYDYFTSAKNYKRLRSYKEISIDVNGALFGYEEIKNHRNIYIIVLESFMDPRLIEGAVFSRSPLYEGMKEYLKGEEFSLCTSVTYGGGTAQAEFEVLSGVPARSEIKSIDFNVLEGRESSGFVRFLKDNGYKTYANIATTPDFFNSINAYTSLGFSELHFLKSEGISAPKNSHIFDGTLFEYTLKQLATLPKEEPHILYTLGMYGHFPLKSNYKVGSDLIEVNIDSPDMHALANQFYYRTKALSEYIDAILKLDSTAIIFVTSDHLPPIKEDLKMKYSREIYTNVCLMIDGERGKVKWGEDPKKHYKIASEILKLMGITPKEIDDYTDLYYKLLFDSLR